MLQAPTIELGTGAALLITGGAIALLGVVATAFAYEAALLSERLDAVGSKTRLEDVEPAVWKVQFTRFSGVVVALFGVWRILRGTSYLL